MLGFHVDELVLEFANREMAELDALGEIAAAGRDVAAGVVDVKNYAPRVGRGGRRAHRRGARGRCPARPAVARPGLRLQPDRPPGDDRQAPRARRRTGPGPRTGRRAAAAVTGGPSTDAGVIEAAGRVRGGEWTSVGLVAACLDRIDALEPTIEAWVHVDARAALAEARERDAAVADGRPLGPLHGVPLGIKDIIDVAGMPTRAGAAAFAHTLPTVDAPLVARLRDAGAVILGKTHATQFAYQDPAPTRNPSSLGHTPGGSSSGSAAAVAARMVPGGDRDADRGLDPAARGLLRGRRLQGRVSARSRSTGSCRSRWRWTMPADRPVRGGCRAARRRADRRARRGPVGRRAAHRRRPRLGRSRGAGATAPPRFAGDRFEDAGARVVESTCRPPSTAWRRPAGSCSRPGAAATHDDVVRAHAADYAPTIRDLVLAGQARSPCRGGRRGTGSRSGT